MRIYGRWSGNERGRREDETRCVVSVYSRGSYISGQCQRKRGHGPDGLYCTQHGKKADAGEHFNVPEDV